MASTMARCVWIIGAQVLALLLFALLLGWAGASYRALPAAEGGTAWSQALRQLLSFTFHPQVQTSLVKLSQQLLAVLALGLLVVSVAPRLRRGPVAGILCGITLAVAASLAAGVTFSLDDPGELGLAASYVPVAAPVTVLAAVLAATWGALVRIRLSGTARLGVAALAGAGLLLLCYAKLAVLVNAVPPFATLYAPIEAYQIAELVSALLLYPAAMWLGSTGLRPTGGLRILPFGMAAVIGLYFVYWRAH